MSAPVKLSSVLADDTAYATTLLTIVVDTYGTDALSWAPETLVMEINDDFSITLPPGNTDRLMTAIQLLTTDDFFKSLPDFVNFCNILSGDTYDPRNWDPADAAEIAWGITEGLIINPPDDDDENPFTEEIVAYIGAVLDQEGIINPPDVLKIALRDNNPNTAIGDFSDDPEMFDAVYDFEQSKTDGITQMLKSNLSRLSQQLAALPLRSGNAKDAVANMLQST